jgi:glutathione S-transferase
MDAVHLTQVGRMTAPRQPGGDRHQVTFRRRGQIGLRLLIGNKNYSSWSLRPWLAMRVAGVAFEEQAVSLSDPNFKKTVTRISPAGQVPALEDGEVCVWETLAILEYLNEEFPAAQLWPAERTARAQARALAAEVHAGFAALRRECPMNMWRPPKAHPLSAEARANVARIDAMWTDWRACFARQGSFLFGRFSAVDAMYAPVVSRFATYTIEVGPARLAYMEAVTALAAWQEWRAAALKEPWVRTGRRSQGFETGRPLTRRSPRDKKAGCVFAKKYSQKRADLVSFAENKPASRRPCPGDGETLHQANDFRRCRHARVLARLSCYRAHGVRASCSC